MSLCVTELKNNMAVYLDNMEVKSPAVNNGPGLARFPGQRACGSHRTSTSCRNQMEEIVQWLAAGQKRAHWIRAGSEPVELSGSGVPTGQGGVPTGDEFPTGQGQNSLASEPSEWYSEQG